MITYELDRLASERDRLAAGERELLLDRHIRNEYNDKFWAAVERMIPLPAKGRLGLRVKADTIELIQRQRDDSNSLTDWIMCGVGFRLALSLAADIKGGVGS